MKFFDAEAFQHVVDELFDLANRCEWSSYFGEDEDSNTKFNEQAKEMLLSAGKLCNKHDFSNALSTISVSLNHLEREKGDCSAIRVEAQHAAHAITNELGNCVFLQVSPERRDFLDNSYSLGMSVVIAFPSAVPDITEAGNCLAADCNTAAVFHLMRVVEWGLRGFCVHMGLNKAKSGKNKYTPISHTDWEHLLNQLYPRIESKIEKIKRGPGKQAAQEFYYPLWQDVKAIREAYRNHVMHSRSEYNAADADAIFNHVKRFMELLSTKVSEKGGAPKNDKKIRAQAAR